MFFQSFRTFISAICYKSFLNIRRRRLLMQHKAVVNPEKKTLSWRKKRLKNCRKSIQVFHDLNDITSMWVSRCLSPLPILSFALYLPVTLSIDVLTFCLDISDLLSLNVFALKSAGRLWTVHQRLHELSVDGRGGRSYLDLSQGLNRLQKLLLFAVVLYPQICDLFQDVPQLRPEIASVVGGALIPSFLVSGGTRSRQLLQHLVEQLVVG